MNKRAENCVVCGKSLAGLKWENVRIVCDNFECGEKRNKEKGKKYYEAKKAASKFAPRETGITSSARRSQGRFFVPDRQEKLCAEVKESFVCWACHRLHGPESVGKLKIKCTCSALYSLSLGEGAGGPSIVRVDRWL